MRRHTRSTAKRTEGTALFAARVELLVSGWRIMRAVDAFPQGPDMLTVRRWNAGLAREAVSPAALMIDRTFIDTWTTRVCDWAVAGDRGDREDHCHGPSCLPPQVSPSGDVAPISDLGGHSPSH